MGRQSITTIILMKIQNISSVNGFMSAPKIKAKVENKSEIHLSTETIRRRLREDNKHARVAERVPLFDYITVMNKCMFGERKWKFCLSNVLNKLLNHKTRV